MTNVFYWYDNFTIAYVHPLAFCVIACNKKDPQTRVLIVQQLGVNFSLLANHYCDDACNR